MARSTVFVDVGVSLDGYLAGPNRGPRNPLGDEGTSIHQWLFETASFREHLGLPGGGAGWWSRGRTATCATRCTQARRPRSGASSARSTTLTASA